VGKGCVSAPRSPACRSSLKVWDSRPAHLWTAEAKRPSRRDYACGFLYRLGSHRCARGCSPVITSTVHKQATTCPGFRPCLFIAR